MAQVRVLCGTLLLAVLEIRVQLSDSTVKILTGHNIYV